MQVKAEEAVIGAALAFAVLSFVSPLFLWLFEITMAAFLILMLPRVAKGKALWGVLGVFFMVLVLVFFLIGLGFFG